jgi:16S rRNA pseudouridine516 synthase
MKPRHHPSVMSLLPLPLRVRGLQPVGRLDEDTTGLLLLTDDGALIHRLTSPKHKVPKVYEVTARHPVDARQLQALRDGVVLDDDPAPARALDARTEGDHRLLLTLAEGRYHQVKRMVAAVGNRCDALHRSRFGALVLPTDLPAGQWRWCEPGDITPAA